MKIKLLKIVNLFLGLAFLLQVISVVTMILEIGPGWIYSMHSINGLVFILLVIVHIVLNWAWIRVNFMKKKENTIKSV